MVKIHKKILIVEDENSLLSVLREGFINEGFSVVTARDGGEGLIAAKEEKPDLILLDIKMPKVDGIAMAQQIKKTDSGMPIIFLTNFDDLKHISEAVEVSQSDYLVKSDWDLAEIVKRVKARLGQ